jgi:uncharacterized protein YcnI
MHNFLRAAAVAFCLAFSHAAFAHVTATVNDGAAGSYFQTGFRVPHGCSGSATIAVRVKIPDGVIAVKPQMKPGWTIEIKRRTLPQPIDAGHGVKIVETVDEVIWRGGPLADAYYDDFGLTMKLPDAAGRTLWFPLVQECEQGVHRWIEIPAPGQKWDDLREPAPFVKVRTAP